MKYKKAMAAIVVVVSLTVISLMFCMGGKDTKHTEDKKAEENHASDEKEEISYEEVVSYEGMGNTQGNTELGGKQTWVAKDKILLEATLDAEGTDGTKLLYFNTNKQELRLACDKEDCLHKGADCTANNDLLYLQSYASVFYGVSFTYRNEIWKCEKGSLSCYYKNDDDILALWGYDGYLYFCTEFALFRIPLDKKAESEQVLDKPVNFSDLTFYKDKMYFCEESWMLYRANLDGSEKERLWDKKMAFPQVYEDRIYYRSLEYDEQGAWEHENTLYSISLDGKDQQKVLDEVYQFSVCDNGIYYLDIPKEGEEGTTEGSSSHFLDFATGEQRKIADGIFAYLYVCPESDWIVFEKIDEEQPELAPGEIRGPETHLYCIKKDGSQEKRLDYPQIITD